MNNKGFSLVEGIIALGILIGIALFFMKGTEINTSNQRKNEMNSILVKNMQDILNTIGNVLRNSKTADELHNKLSNIVITGYGTFNIFDKNLVRYTDKKKYLKELCKNQIRASDDTYKLEYCLMTHKMDGGKSENISDFVIKFKYSFHNFRDNSAMTLSQYQASSFGAGKFEFIFYAGSIGAKSFEILPGAIFVAK